MNSKQFELLLQQLLDCSCAINGAIKNDMYEELDNLLSVKDEKIKLTEENKKFVGDISKFGELIEKIKKQEAENLKLLATKKDFVYEKTQKNFANTKVLKKYEQLTNINGSIVDIRE